MPIRSKIAPHIADIIRELQNAGYESYIVGGAVRDLMLGRQPKDYDLSTAATPEQVRRVFRDRHVIIIGKRFRLVHLHHGKDIIEISTFRRRPSAPQSLHKPSRAADAPENMIFHDNEFGTAEEDALRRDFTVNAIFYDPVNAEFKDYTGQGLSDITNGIVRSIGDAALRFEEDPVRILRALKLVGQYGFTLEADTEKALVSCMDLIVHASSSRMTLELEKILKNPYSDGIFAAFRKYGFLKRFLPYLDAKWDTPQGQYMMELLRERNRRVLEGKYRDSISLAISLIALPFAEELFDGGQPGSLWNYFPGIESELKSLILSALHPRTPTKRAVCAAIRTLQMQTRIKTFNSVHRVVSHPGYPHSRELGIIQNNVMWHIEDFETLWPETDSSSHSRRKHSGKRRGKFNRPRRDPSEQGNDVGVSTDQADFTID